MNLLLLSGNNKRGKEWLRQVDASLAPQFDRTYCHDYAHWQNAEAEIDLNHEAERLAAATQDLSPYIIFAKSAGTILTSKAAAMNILRPQACLFVGLPLAMIRHHKLPARDWLEKTDFPIVILQHTADPLGSYQEVEQYVKSMGRENVTVHELPGNTHDYLEFQTFNTYATELAR
ncbi:MAG TPA: alpha/beta family hydrolase [Candidatus Saccharimonadales bacterium]|nr:alpha/beta family hydrolase [Candidatus Saccharimonadales bacterium]